MGPERQYKHRSSPGYLPLCRAAVLYPDIMNALKKHWIPDRLKLNEHIQATKFFIRTKQ